MSHDPIDLRFFENPYPDDESRDFWEHGAGAASWYVDEWNQRFIRILTPHARRDYEYVSLPVKPYDGNMASWEWDGNLEKPTLTPSISIITTGGWHGFITNGQMIFSSWN